MTISELMQWEKKVTTLQKKVKDLKVENSTLTNQISNLKIEQEEHKSLIVNKSTRQDLNVEGLEERCKALQQILDQTTLKNNEIESQYNLIKEKNKGLQEDYEQQNKELKDLREEAKEKF